LFAFHKASDTLLKDKRFCISHWAIAVSQQLQYWTVPLCFTLQILPLSDWKFGWSQLK